MTFSDNIPWMLTFVLCYFLTTLCVKTSLPAPIFTNSLSHRVGKRWQHLNSRNKGWAVQELPISQGHVQQITQKIRGVSKACWGKRGLSSLCSACSCPEQASSRFWQEGFKNLGYPLLDSELLRGTSVLSESSLHPSLESVTAPSWLFIVFSQAISFWFLHFDLQGSLPSAEVEILDMREK